MDGFAGDFDHKKTDRTTRHFEGNTLKQVGTLGLFQSVEITIGPITLQPHRLKLDYSFRQARLILRKNVHQCRAFSIRDERWRYVHWLDEPEQLFDLQADPQEFNDLGRDTSASAVRTALRDRLLDFLSRRRHRVTLSDAQIEHSTAQHKRAGVYFGQW